MGQKKFFQISFLIFKKTHLIKKGSRLKLYKTFNSTSKASEFWDLQVFGKVPRSWDSPGATGIFPKTQSTQNFLALYFSSSRISESRDLEVFGKVQGPGTVPGRWDCPKDPESQHVLWIYYLHQRPKIHGTVLGSWGFWQSPPVLGRWDCPKDPESWHVQRWYFSLLKVSKSRNSPGILRFLAESQCPGTVPGCRDCPKDPESWHVSWIYYLHRWTNLVSFSSG